MTLSWLNKQPDKQYRTESYLKRIAQRIHQSWVKNPKAITLEHQEIKFVREDQKPQETPETAEAKVQREISFWKGFVGFGSKKKKQQ